MIQNAADITLDQSPGTLPNMSGTIIGWFQKLNFRVITRRMIEYKLVETESEIETMGVRQPLKPQQLGIKPEGERRWKYEMLHCLPDVDLQVDDAVIFKDTRYRVIERLAWPEYGYLQFNLAQSFEGEVEP